MLRLSDALGFTSCLVLTAICSAPSNAAALIPAAALAQKTSFVVALPLHNEAELETLVGNEGDPKSPLYHHFLTPAQFRARYGATAAEMQSAVAELRGYGLTVVRQGSQGLELSGSVANVNRAFGISLAVNADRFGRIRATTRHALTLPHALAALHATVLGLAAIAPKHIDARRVSVPANRYGNAGPYWFDDLKQAYAYPSFTTGLTGTGVTIGILIDSSVSVSDLYTYGQHEKYTTYAGGTPPPVLELRTVLGGAPVQSSTDPYNPNGDGVEAALDMEQALGSAPGATAVIYDIPQLTDDAITAGLTDIDEDNLVDVVSISFGGCELAYTAAYNFGVDYTGVLQAYHALFLQGNAEGITFVNSSGDDAGLACPSANYFVAGTPGTFVPSVEHPADDPNVTAVGGTNLSTTFSSTSLASNYVNENAYGDPEIPYDPYMLGQNVSGGVFGSGSGQSVVFSKPPFQTLVDTRASMRAVPDVAMQMGGCPAGLSIVGGPANFCGYAPPLKDEQPRSAVYAYYTGPGTLPGGYLGLIGTSVSAPEFAGLLAIKAQTLNSRLGNVNGLLYALGAANGASAHAFFHQGIPGYNGVLTRAGGESGYSPFVGLGTPEAANFLGFPTGPLAGNPQTPSNP